MEFANLCNLQTLERYIQYLKEPPHQTTAKMPCKLAACHDKFSQEISPSKAHINNISAIPKS
jgi:hypothetical protein